MMLLKKLYDKLVAKVNSIDTSEFVLKLSSQFYLFLYLDNTDKSELENKICDTSGLVKKQTAILKLLKQKIKYQILVVQPQILH